VKPKRTIKANDVWHTPRSYRRVVYLYGPEGRRAVSYETCRGSYRRCLLSTFRRWVRERKARRGQRHRRRTLALA
jgi:hypothetical protein